MAAASLSRRKLQVAVAVGAICLGSSGAYAGWLQNTRLVNQITREKLFGTELCRECSVKTVVHGMFVDS